MLRCFCVVDKVFWVVARLFLGVLIAKPWVYDKTFILIYGEILSQITCPEHDTCFKVSYIPVSSMVWDTAKWIMIAAVALSRWMLHIGGGWGDPPPLLCKAHWVPRKALYTCNKLLFIIIIIMFVKIKVPTGVFCRKAMDIFLGGFTKELFSEQL